MKTYNVYIRSNEHPRTINTPMMGRCYYTRISVKGMGELKEKVAQLRESGEKILEIRTDFGTRIYL